MINQASLLNIVEMLAWLHGLAIWASHKDWVVLCLLMGSVVHKILNNALLPLYLVLLFNVLFSGVLWMILFA